METIVAAIAAGLILLWGGALALLKTAERLESRHVLGFGAYATAVAGVVIGLVLFIAQERQRDHRRELQEQMKGVTERLGDLSEQLVGQLAEKADLTASEFEVRSRLQNEKAAHRETRDSLGDLNVRYLELEAKLEKERRARLQYQEGQNRQAAERFRKEEVRYEGIREVLDLHRGTMEGVQDPTCPPFRMRTTRLNKQVSGLSATQNSLIGKMNATAEVEDMNTRKIDAVARSQASLYRDISRTMTQVDSLYRGKRK